MAGTDAAAIFIAKSIAISFADTSVDAQAIAGCHFTPFNSFHFVPAKAQAGKCKVSHDKQFSKVDEKKNKITII
ncbi:hypothetical protein CK934_20890 [Chitinophaga sp. MD30]|nr:hypothetical protein CK934_20890 [Chitinophaga sp. MD30]